MSLQFKAYLVKNNQARCHVDNVKEIRRFNIDTDEASSYDYFKNKVTSVFPDIGESFTLHYKDTEDELISFSSNEELIQALAQINDGIFRLYIRAKGEGNKKKGGNGKGWCRFGASRGKYPHEPPHHLFDPGLFGPPHHHHEHHQHGHPPPPPHHNTCAGFGMAPDFGGFGPWGHPHAGSHTQAQCHTGEEHPKQSASSSEDNTDQQQSQEAGASATDARLAEALKKMFAMGSSDEGASGSSDLCDARLAEALKKMFAMGFSDEGGWLSGLLEAHDLDISRALDAIHPGGCNRA